MFFLSSSYWTDRLFYQNKIKNESAYIATMCLAGHQANQWDVNTHTCTSFTSDVFRWLHGKWVKRLITPIKHKRFALVRYIAHNNKQYCDCATTRRIRFFLRLPLLYIFRYHYCTFNSCGDNKMGAESRISEMAHLDSDARLFSSAHHPVQLIYRNAFLRRPSSYLDPPFHTIVFYCRLVSLEVMTNGTRQQKG